MGPGWYTWASVFNRVIYTVGPITIQSEAFTGLVLLRLVFSIHHASPSPPSCTHQHVLSFRQVDALFYCLLKWICTCLPWRKESGCCIFPPPRWLLPLLLSVSLFWTNLNGSPTFKNGQPLSTTLILLFTSLIFPVSCKAHCLVTNPHCSPSL